MAVAAIALAQQPDLLGYMLPTRFTLDANHALVAGLVFVVGVVAVLGEIGVRRPGGGAGRGHRASLAAVYLLVTLALAALSGLVMLLRIPALDTLTRLSYTVFDLALVLAVLGAVYVALRRAVRLQAVPARERG
jgi:hypothetical protein